MNLSIIIPLYNAEQYIVQCINSILNQIVDGVEIIIVNDGSKDSSHEIVTNNFQEFIQKGTLKYIQQENSGVSVARNNGIALAQGRYITFIDADDLISSDYLSSILYVIETENVDIIEFGFKIFTEGDQIEENLDCFVHSHFGICTIDKCINEIFAKSMWYSFLRVFKKSLFEQYQFQFPRGVKFCEDMMLLSEIYDKSNSVYQIKKALYHYRINNTSASFRLSPDYYTNIESFYLKILDRKEDHYALLKASVFYNLYSYIRMTDGRIRNVDPMIMKDIRSLRFFFFKNRQILSFRRFRLAVFPKLSLFLDRIRNNNSVGLTKVKRK